MTTKTLRVLLADDHPVVLDALANRMRAGEGFDVVGQAGDGAELVRLYAQTRPDVVLCDIHMPKVDGIEAAKQILALDPDAKIVMLSGLNDQPSITSALDAGCVGYIQKLVDADEIYDAVRQAAEGLPVFDRATASQVVAATRKGASSGPELTEREIQILQLIANGASNVEIAGELNLSPSTVKSYVAQMFPKLGVNDRAEAVAVGFRLNLIR